jgi:sulfide:quinone oxidoreductase
VGKQILILGGGFGGLAAAHTLRKILGTEHRIILVDRQPLFRMGLTKLWIINSTMQGAEFSGNRTVLTKAGIDFLEGEVSAISIAEHFVRVGKQKVGFDYLIIALGADYSPESVPGFTKYAKNLYTESGCAEIRDALHSFKKGVVTILVSGLPFKCPPAPYEASMIIDDVLRKTGVRENVTLQLITPETHPLTILGPEAGVKVTRLLEERRIEFHPSQEVREIQRNNTVTEQNEFSHDLMFAIPIHVAPQVLKNSGLVDQTGWIPVDSNTLATNTPQVYAIGDCAGTRIPKGALLPRAGVLAEKQGIVVAENIIHEVNGTRSSASFAGDGVCFMEVGGGKAAPVRANFYDKPAPTWQFTEPSSQGFQEKQRFLRERMDAWFAEK